MWNKKDEETLIQLFNEKKTYKQIAIVLGKSYGAVSEKAKRMGLSKQIKWDDDTINLLIQLRDTKLSYKDIGKEMGCSEHAIKTKCSYLIKEGLINPKKNSDPTICESELISLVKKYETVENYNKHLKEDNLVPIYRINKYFGSWTEARIAAGLKKSSGALDPNKLTTVYFLYFMEEDFYKVGITQRSIKDRFARYPEYIILDTVELSLEKAKELEKQSLTNKLKYVPKHYRFHRSNGGGAGGETECFKSDEILESLNELRQN